MSAPTEEAAPRPLRVGYLVPPTSGFAGIEHVTHELATGLALTYPSLLEVHVLYGRRYPELDDLHAPYRLHVLGVEQLREIPVALRRHLREHPLDVLVTPQVEATALSWLGLRGRGMPVLVPYMHGNPRIERLDGSRSTKALFALFERTVARTAPVVLTVSAGQRDYVASTMRPRGAVVLVRNPVRDLLGEHGSVPQVREAGGRLELVSVGRLSLQKGHDVLLRALAAARPDLGPVRLTIVGGGTEEGALRTLVTTLGLDDVVEMVGARNDPTEYLRRADCFVLASRWEGFALVLVEALQHGLPIVATDCDFGPADIVVDAELGALVPPDDVESFAEALRAVPTRPRTPEGDERRRRAARAFTGPQVIAAHYSVLRSVAPLDGR